MLVPPGDPIALATAWHDLIQNPAALQSFGAKGRNAAKGKREWHIVREGAVPDIKPDPDPPHLEGASGGAYVEALPDSRVTHGDKLVKGENFHDVPGESPTLHYKVEFTTPGRYYVWLRTFSTGTEDNGTHVGLNGKWPESGRR